MVEAKNLAFRCVIFHFGISFLSSWKAYIFLPWQNVLDLLILWRKGQEMLFSELAMKKEIVSFFRLALLML